MPTPRMIPPRKEATSNWLLGQGWGVGVEDGPGLLGVLFCDVTVVYEDDGTADVVFGVVTAEVLVVPNGS